MFYNREREKISKEMGMYCILYMMLYIHVSERMFPSSFLQQFSDISRRSILILELKLMIKTNRIYKCRVMMNTWKKK